MLTLDIKGTIQFLFFFSFFDIYFSLSFYALFSLACSLSVDALQRYVWPFLCLTLHSFPGWFRLPHSFSTNTWRKELLNLCSQPRLLSPTPDPYTKLTTIYLTSTFNSFFKNWMYHFPLASDPKYYWVSALSEGLLLVNKSRNLAIILDSSFCLKSYIPQSSIYPFI